MTQGKIYKFTLEEGRYLRSLPEGSIMERWQEVNDCDQEDIPVEDIIANRLTLIEAHDKSAEVNSFFIGESSMWIDRETRSSLFYSMTIEQQAGATESTLYSNGTAYTAPIDSMLAMLAALELYAKECYRVTQSHIAAINSMTKEQIKEYDITSGYPERLTFNL